MYDSGKHNESGVEYLTLCTDIQKYTKKKNKKLWSCAFRDNHNDSG